jgi:ankyrin repeat protein
VKLYDVLTILKMIRVNPDLANDCDKLQMTPLHWASKRGYDNIVLILLDYGG